MLRLKPHSLLLFCSSLPALALLSLSCSPASHSLEKKVQVEAQKVATAVDSACADGIFGIGRPISLVDLQNYDVTKFSLESVAYRDVIYRAPDQVEIAYRVDMKMRLSADRFLVPEHTLACHEEKNPSKRALTLSQTMIPVIGDLHLPSTRITIFDASTEGKLEDRDRLYNYPRISEISVSNKGYFSFNQNWAPYRKTQSLAQYLDLLRTRSFFSKVEVREMGYGRLGIYAEKDVAGERAQLLISLVEGG
ncbi:MAG: hypothetical protein H7301_06090 [Cryobacterium sp.]|nr:hypothetical protein [Oligoflexia bacterium]